MRGFNKVILAGNLTADPELRYTPKGSAVAKMSLAVNRSFKLESGEQREEVTYVDVEAWGQQAETLAQFMRKGKPLLVEGRLKLDQWDDKQTGQKRRALKVALESFTFIDARGPEGAGEGGGPPRSQGSAPYSSPRPQARPGGPPPSSAPPPASDGPPPEDDDVPF